jgi:hypothetical protein
MSHSRIVAELAILLVSLGDASRQSLAGGDHVRVQVSCTEALQQAC